jgi:hypothetical protein
MEVIPLLDNFSNVVVRLNFTYGNSEASLNGSCLIPTPDGEFVPLDSISKELALEWLLAHCPNSTQEFDANLDVKLAETAKAPFVYRWTETP